MTELLARIEMHGPQFGVGRGKSETTGDDIRGALGMVRDKFATAMLLLTSNSSMAVPDECYRALYSIQEAEWCRREDAIVTAKLAKEFALQAHGAERVRRLRDATHMLESAKAQQWPHWTKRQQRYSDIRSLVLSELCGTAICVYCNGRGAVIAGELVIKCPRCAGLGRKRRTPAYRARCLGVSQTTFTRCWEPIFDWTQRQCADAAQRGERVFHERLTDDFA